MPSASKKKVKKKEFRPRLVEIRFSVLGDVKQTVIVTRPGYSPQRLQSLLNGGEVLTTIQENGQMVVQTSSGKETVIGTVVDVENECSYELFEVEGLENPEDLADDASFRLQKNFRANLLELLKHSFGDRNVDQEGSQLTEVFEHAVHFLREKYLALPGPGRTHHNHGGPMYATLIDHCGMQVNVYDLNANGCIDGIYQAKQLVDEISGVFNGEDEEKEGDSP